eukprot:1355684-Heterocapsa_arctica.AAC.1
MALPHCKTADPGAGYERILSGAEAPLRKRYTVSSPQRSPGSNEAPIGSTRGSEGRSRRLL